MDDESLVLSSGVLSDAADSITPPVPPPTPQPPNTIFRGPNGIRAGWRVAIFLLLVAVIGVLLAMPFAFLRILNKGAGPDIRIAVSGLTPLGLGITEGVLFIVPSIAALIMAKIERRKYGQYGLPARFAFRKDFWIGTVVGFLSISGSVGPEASVFTPIVLAIVAILFTRVYRENCYQTSPSDLSPQTSAAS